MTQLHFEGPITVGDELALAMWKALPAMYRSGTAQLFFQNFSKLPMTKEIVAIFAKCFFEKEGMGKEGVKAIREAVQTRCREIGIEQIDQDQAKKIALDEFRKQCVAAATEQAGGMFKELLTKEELVAAAQPSVSRIVQELAHRYFHTIKEGQQWVLELIEEVKREYRDKLKAAMMEEMESAVARKSVVDFARNNGQGVDALG